MEISNTSRINDSTCVTCVGNGSKILAPFQSTVTGLIPKVAVFRKIRPYFVTELSNLSYIRKVTDLYLGRYPDCPNSRLSRFTHSLQAVPEFFLRICYSHVIPHVPSYNLHFVVTFNVVHSK